MGLEQLIAAARKAIEDGDLAKAQELTEQIKAHKALNDLTDTDSDEVQALRLEVEGLREFKNRIENEPANNKAGTVVVIEDEADKKVKQPWKSLGEFLVAVRQAAQYPGAADARLKAQKAVQGASEGVPADGGYLVQNQYADEIFQLEHAESEILGRTRRFPVGPNNNGLILNGIDETSRVTGSRWGGVRGYWAAEGDSVTATKPKFRQIELKLNKLIAVVYATDELLADTTQFAAVSRTAVNEELTWLAENAFMRGTGAGQPQGVLSANALVTVAKESGQAAATLVQQNIVKMYSRMWARSRQNAIWLINQDVEPQLFSLVDAGSNSIYMPPGGLSASPFGTLMGRPVIPSEFCSTLGTVGDILFVDFGQYITIDKGGVEEQSSMHVEFLTDQMTFRWTYRVDGKPGWSSALTPANGSNTQSPYIALATRS